jgi:multimeric flavodoxin WrbA
MRCKHILILKGSPREKGNSSLLADQVAAGARDKSAEVEIFTLQAMDIQPCSACESCQEESPGVCIIEDDMQLLYPRLKAADAIVVATPIYWFTLSAQAKLCIDRWYAFEGPQGSQLRGKRFGFILTYGDDDSAASGVMNAIHTYQDMCRYLKSEIVDIIHASASAAGEINKQPALLTRAYQLGEKLAKGS